MVRARIRIYIYIYILWIKMHVYLHVLLGLYGRSSVCTRLLVYHKLVLGNVCVLGTVRQTRFHGPSWLPTYGDSRKEDCCFLMRERARQRDESSSSIYRHWIPRFLLHERRSRRFDVARGGSKSRGLRFIETFHDRSFSDTGIVTSWMDVNDSEHEVLRRLS